MKTIRARAGREEAARHSHRRLTAHRTGRSPSNAVATKRVVPPFIHSHLLPIYATVSLYCIIVIWCFQGLSEHPSTSQHYPRLNPVSTHLSPDSPYLLLRNIPAVRLSKLSPQATHSHTAMGASLSRLWSLIWTKKEIRILILGLVGGMALPRTRLRVICHGS